MKINKKIIDDIFNNKIQLKNKKDIAILSEYMKYIPMFDINTLKVYPIKNIDLHDKLTRNHMRFINNHIIEWMKHRLKDDKYNTIEKKILQNNLDILKNYDIDILKKTTITAFYKFSPKYGLDIDICLRKVYDKRFQDYMKPYYSKTEMIALGKNMKIIDNNTTVLDIIDRKKHYKICKIINDNDITLDLLKEHSDIIINNNIKSIICYYSFYGSYFFNNILREYSLENKFLNKPHINMITKLHDTIMKVKPFKKNYTFYRFIYEDSFLKKLKIGDIFTDKGFMSCTRDPFYEPGLENNFGLILLKITIPKNIPGTGLFIENFSLFKKELEFIFNAGSSFKLISKDDKFKYYHTNPKFEKLIKKKYEFTYIGNKSNMNILKKVNLNYSYQTTFDIEGSSLKERFKYHIDYNTIKYSFKMNNYIVYCYEFDSSDVYKNLFYNQQKNGLLLYVFEDNSIITTIELGDMMVINYILKFFHNKETKIIYDLYYNIAKLFGYKDYYIYNTYKHFITIKNQELFTNTMKYNYDLINSTKLNKYETYPFGYIQLNNILNSNEFVNLPQYKNDSLREFLKKIINNDDYYYYNYIDRKLINKYGKDIFMKKVNALQYWKNKDITYNIFKEDNQIKIYNILYNRRRL